MVGTKLDFKAIQYINLFSKITGTRARDCFKYADYIIFEVPQFLLSKTIGANGNNIKKLSSIIKKKIKVIPSTHNIEEFITSVTYPLKFKKIVLENNELTIFASTQSKAMLIGRGSVRLEELKDILKNRFGIKRLRVL